MMVRDAESIIASIAYDPNERTRLRPDSAGAFFGPWCPVGIPARPYGAPREAHRVAPPGVARCRCRGRQDFVRWEPKMILTFDS